MPDEVDYSVYMIDPGDWESATGQCVDRSVMVRVLPGEFSRCEWTYNEEHERWDTECEDVVVDQNDETPKDFGFKFCPYCGKLISWNDAAIDATIKDLESELTAAQQRVAELLLLITTIYNGLHRGIGPMASASDGEIASTINDTMHNIFGNEWKTQ